MNKQIRELAEQARKHFPKTETSGEFWVFDEQKFAELIVRECATIADTAEPYKANDLILKHFGVSE